jgi:hypothetical protein
MASPCPATGGGEIGPIRKQILPLITDNTDFPDQKIA